MIRGVVELVAVTVFAILSVYELAVAVSSVIPLRVFEFVKVFIPVPSEAVSTVKDAALPSVTVIESVPEDAWK
jgi:hypothetical protein